MRDGTYRSEQTSVCSTDTREKKQVGVAFGEHGDLSEASDGAEEQP